VKKKTGRKHGLTDEVWEVLVASRGRGLSYKRCASVAGIGESTLMRWLAEGEPADAPQRLREFREAMTQALDKKVDLLAEKVWNAALADNDESVRVAQWLLARIGHHEFGTHQNHQHTVQHEGKIEVVKVEGTDTEVAEVAQELRAKVARLTMQDPEPRAEA